MYFCLLHCAYRSVTNPNRQRTETTARRMGPILRSTHMRRNDQELCQSSNARTVNGPIDITHFPAHSSQINFREKYISHTTTYSFRIQRAIFIDAGIRSKLRRVLTFALGEDKIAADQNKNDQLNLFASKVLSASEAMFAKGYDRPFHVPRYICHARYTIIYTYTILRLF